MNGARAQFLARARFPSDENAGIAPGDERDFLDGCQKRLALAHKLLQSQSGFQRLRERVLWPGPFQRPPEPREDINGLQRWGDEILDADLEQPHYFFRRVRLEDGEERDVH